MFQSTYLYKVRLNLKIAGRLTIRFNPRTYIRYDSTSEYLNDVKQQFQSTYLYKVRLRLQIIHWQPVEFQSTYLYKVRLLMAGFIQKTGKFQSTYLYKVRLLPNTPVVSGYGFNPRTYIRYDESRFLCLSRSRSFNPRTYIRYDQIL